jgi:hypothetical protein
VRLTKGIAVRADDRSRLPWVFLRPASFNGTAVLWIDGGGKSHLFASGRKPTAAVRALLADGKAAASADLFLTGEFIEPGKPVVLPKVDPKYAGHTYGYNRSVLANRVHDVLTALGALKKNDQVRRIELVGTGLAGPCVLFAAGLLGDDPAREHIEQVAADLDGLSFEKIPAAGSATFLPGALKYGGVGGLTALAAPIKLSVYGTQGIPADELSPLVAAYKAAGSPLTLESHPLADEAILACLRACGPEVSAPDRAARVRPGSYPRSERPRRGRAPPLP